MDRMEGDGITIAERDDEPAYTGFKCLDPGGHPIEVHWELPLSRYCGFVAGIDGVAKRIRMAVVAEPEDQSASVRFMSQALCRLGS